MIFPICAFALKGTAVSSLIKNHYFGATITAGLTLLITSVMAGIGSVDTTGYAKGTLFGLGIFFGLATSLFLMLPVFCNCKGKKNVE